MTRFFLYCLILIPYTAKSSTDLIIEVPDNQPFVLVINNLPYLGTGVVEVFDIPAGQRSVALLRQSNNGNGRIRILAEEKLTLIDGLEQTYRLLPNGQLMLVRSVPQPSFQLPQEGNGYEPVEEPRIVEMDGQSFEQFKSELKRQTFDSDKLTYVETYTKNTWFSSQQALLILRNFTYDENKIIAAQVLYHRVVDPNNYFKVNETFTFSSSKDKLAEYIKVH